MKKYWKQFVEWATALRFRPFRNARVKLTALYIINTIVILGVFLIILGYLREKYLLTDLRNAFAPNTDTESFVKDIYNDLQSITMFFVVLIAIALGILNYLFIRITLKPLKDFSERQRRFISDASHELRTPLSTIRAENEIALLDTENLSRDEAVSLLRSNLEEVDRISTILNNLLNLASFSSATGAPPFAPVNISAVTARALDSIKIVADRKNIQIFKPSQASILAWGNATALEEVAANLIKNAIQYTPPGGSIFLSTSINKKDKKVALTIQDTGIGISTKDLPYIFEPFYRSDNSLHMHQQGNGLGLPLVREIVNRHHGSINIQSEVDKGTLITVLVPAAP